MLKHIADRLGVRMALVATLILGLFLYAANLWFGTLNQDEGWYLYAALSSHHGLMPYRDFFFTQGPVMPLVYGLLAPLWSPFGVAGGRALTLLFGVAGCVMAAGLAAWSVGQGKRLAAAVLALTFTAAGVYHSYFTTIPKTYALAGCLLVSAFVALMASGPKGRRGLAAVAGLLLAAAASTRLSLGITLAVTGFWLLWHRRALGSAWFWFGVGGVMGLALLEGPCLLAASDQLLFANTFHVGRAGGRMLLVAGSVARLVRGYLPMALFGAAAVIGHVWKPSHAERHAEPCVGPRWTRLWLLVCAAVVAVHLLSPYPYDDYQVPVMLLLAVIVAVEVLDLVSLSAVRAVVWIAVAAAALTAVSSPMIQDWFVIRQDRFWVVTRESSDLAKLRQVGRWIRENTPANAPLLTQDTYLAVEAQRRVPSGFEMGPFGYFPLLADAQAATNHVLNQAGMLRALRAADASVAALSGYALAIGAPAMRELPSEEQAVLRAALAEHYTCAAKVRNFGQGATTLEIWKRNAPMENVPGINH